MDITRRQILGLMAAAALTTAFPRSTGAQRFNGFSRVKARLDAGENARLMIWSDSTGNCRDNKGRWPMRIAQKLAETYPGHKVLLKNWNTATLAGFDPPIVVSKGKSGATLEVLNIAVSGSVPQLVMGELWPLTIGSAEPDGLIINHGINLVLGWNPKDQNGVLWLGAMLTAIWQFWTLWPACPISGVLQTPQRDNASQDQLGFFWQTVSAIAGIPVIDVFSIYQDAGKPGSWYVDNTHPSEPTGNTIWADAIWSHYLAATPLRADFRNSFLQIQPTVQLLDNPDFARWTDVTKAPDGWSAIGKPEFARDAATTAGAGRNASLRMTASVEQPAGIQQTLPPEKLKLCAGRRVFFTARVDKGDETTANSLGSIQVIVQSASKGAEYLGMKYFNTKQGAFAWWGIGPIAIPLDVTRLEVRLFHHQATVPTLSRPVWFDQASLVLGSTPGVPSAV